MSHTLKPEHALHGSTTVLWRAEGTDHRRIVLFIAQTFSKKNNVPYILESNPHPSLIRTSFSRFLKRKKKLVRLSNPHLSFNRPLPTRQIDSVMSDDGESEE